MKICNVLKVKPQSIVESDSLDMQLLKPEYIKSLKSKLEPVKEEPKPEWEGEWVDEPIEVSKEQ